MDNLSQHTELFDAYLFNELNKDERSRFEDRLRDDFDFAHEFETHKLFLTDLKDGVEYRETIKQIKNIHQSIYHPKKNFFLSRQFMVPLGIAASVALLMLVISPFVFEGSESATSASEDNYAAEELSHENSVAPSYSVSEKDVVMEPVDDDSNAEPSSLLLDSVDSPIIGTAFMISNKGFFLTSKGIVKDYKKVLLQKKSLGLTFETKVIYVDSLEDLAILRCDTELSHHFKPVPYKFYQGNLKQHKSVFAMGYLNDTLKSYQGNLEQYSGDINDTLRSAIKFKNNQVESGFPVFSSSGDLVGMVYTKEIRKKSVTFLLYPNYIQERIRELDEQKKIFIDMSENYKRNAMYHETLVNRYQSFIFEVHSQ